jgi:hypothetical protein
VVPVVGAITMGELDRQLVPAVRCAASQAQTARSKASPSIRAGEEWESGVMNRPRERSEPASALLLQGSVLDERIWAPLKRALQGTIHAVETTPPVCRGILSDEHWAVHAADWVNPVLEIQPIDAVVCHGHAACAGLEIAARGFGKGTVIVIDPTIPSLIPTLGASALEKVYEELEREESQDTLARMFASVPPEELLMFQQTGQLSRENAEQFIDSFLTADDFNDIELFTLIKEMVTARLSAAFAEGVQIGPTPLGIDFAYIAAQLGAKLHIVLSERTAIDRLGLRPQLRAAYPDARIYDLPGADSIQGWWAHTHDYAELLRSIISPASLYATLMALPLRRILGLPEVDRRLLPDEAVATEPLRNLHARGTIRFRPGSPVKPLSSSHCGQIGHGIVHEQVWPRWHQSWSRRD